MKINIVIIGLLLLAVFLFETLVIVDAARRSFPTDWHGEMSCFDVLSVRPWYGQINPWFWFWVLFTPLVCFSLTPVAPAWQRGLRTVVIVSVSYIVLNLYTHNFFDIQNAPFQTAEVSSASSDIEKFKVDCYNIADGASFIFSLVFGWIYAIIYAAMCEAIWYLYHKKITKLASTTYRTDLINRLVIILAVTLPFIFAAWVLLLNYK